MNAGPRKAGAGRLALPRVPSKPGFDGCQPAGGSETLLLLALAHIIGDDLLRDRFLALTGLTGDHLRARASAPETLAAVRAFLEGHEPDLLAVAAALGVEPSALCGPS